MLKQLKRFSTNTSGALAILAALSFSTVAGVSVAALEFAEVDRKQTAYQNLFDQTSVSLVNELDLVKKREMTAADFKKKVRKFFRQAFKRQYGHDKEALKKFNLARFIVKLSPDRTSFTVEIDIAIPGLTGFGVFGDGKKLRIASGASFSRERTSNNLKSVLLLDISSSMTAHVPAMKEGALKFVERIGKGRNNNNRISILPFAQIYGSSDYLDFTPAYSGQDKITSYIDDIDVYSTKRDGGTICAADSLEAIKDYMKSIMEKDKEDGKEFQYNVVLMHDYDRYCNTVEEIHAQCDAVKDLGIDMISAKFGYLANNPDYNSFFEDCASSPELVFDASTADGLLAALIGNAVVESTPTITR